MGAYAILVCSCMNSRLESTQVYWYKKFGYLSTSTDLGELK